MPGKINNINNSGITENLQKKYRAKLGLSDIAARHSNSIP
jgi:hypothetical protein